MDFPRFETLDLEQDGHWLTVWFNTPENRNALTDARVDELLTLCRRLPDTDLRGVVFRGRGGVFCAGGDLKAFRSGLQAQDDPDRVIALSLRAADLFDAVAGLPQYTVMAVEGAAMAGGMGLACCGDCLIALENTTFGLSEVRIGLTPAQIAPFVIRRLGQQAARRLMLTGARFSGKEAVGLGLADITVSNGDELDVALAEERKTMSGVAPGALAAIKAQIADLPHQTRVQQRQAAAESFAGRMLSSEAKEGISAFFDKRKPNWTQG